MVDSTTFGAWLQHRRKTLDLTRGELAQCARCSISALRKIEAGERRPSRLLAGLLARCLGVPDDQAAAFIKIARGETGKFHLNAPVDLQFPEIAAQPPNNLPNVSYPMVGRESELATVGQMLSDPSCRLLTLTGLSGIGKTRLAIDAAATAGNNFPDGIYFVPLASLASSESLLPAIAAAVGFTFHSPADPEIQLFNHLARKSILLLLDNFETCLDSAGLLAEILLHSPHIKLLVTSTERLGLNGEWVFELYGLPAPPPDQSEGIEKFSAVALFVQTAARSRPGFQLSALNRAAITQICRLLGGMPLAIELAASWVRVLSCQDISDEIMRSLNFLVTPMRDIPARHRSVQAIFDYSWNLLTEDERCALCRLAVFQGEFNRLAALQVAGANLLTLASLASKSLLTRRSGSRYALHDLVRQYALSRLREKPLEEAALRDRHSLIYLTLLQSREASLHSSSYVEAAAELISEIENLRMAWLWAASQGHNDPLLKSAWALWYFFEARGAYLEGKTLLLQAVQSLESLQGDEFSDRNLRSYATSYLRILSATLDLRLGNIHEAHTQLLQSLDNLRDSDPVTLSNALWRYGAACMLIDELQAASAALQEAYNLASAANRPWERAVSAILRGRVEFLIGNRQESYRWLQHGQELSREMGDPIIISIAISSFCELAQSLDRVADAEPILHEGIQLSEEADYLFGQALLQEQLARTYLIQVNLNEAHQLCKKSIAVYRQLGDKWSLARALTLLGQITIQEGLLNEADHYFTEAAQTAHRLNDRVNLHSALVGMAAMLVERRKNLQAYELGLHLVRNPGVQQNIKETAATLLESLAEKLTADQILAAEANVKAQSIDNWVNEQLGYKVR